MHILRDALKLFWATADKFAKQRLVLALALVGIGALLAAFSPIALKLAVDKLSAGTMDEQAISQCLALILAYIFSQYIWRCSTELRTLYHGCAEQRVHRHIGHELFKHLVRLPLRFHLERRTGAIGQIAEQGLQGYDFVLQHIIYTVLPVIVELTVVAAVLGNLGHWTYLVLLGVSSVAYVLAFQRGAASLRESANDVSASHVEAHALLTDTLLNSETIKYFDAERGTCRLYDEALRRREGAWHRLFKRRATNGLLVASIFAVSLGLSLILAVRDVAQGLMTVGDFVLVNAYLVRLVQPLEMLGFALRDISQGLAFVNRMLALFREQPEVDKAAARRILGSIRGELVFQDVSLSYGEGRSVLDNVSFRVSAGRTVAVVGVSGSGKSSLVRLLFRLYEPSSGKIFLDDAPIDELAISEVRSAIAVVPQDTVLVHDTIARNIAFGRPEATHVEIEEAAKVAHLHEFIVRLPAGYETLVGERGLKLSGGERQRVAIARAALKRPRIFVFDEATSSLDSRTEREILGNLRDLSSQCTTLVIAHRLSTVVHADEILVLDRGTIAERGTHQLLLTKGGPYAALWRAQDIGTPLSASTCAG